MKYQAMLVVVFLLSQVVSPVWAQDEEDVEPVYATSRILATKNPRLGRYNLRQMLEVLHPGLRKVPSKKVFAEDDIYDWEVIERVSHVRGRFLVKEDGRIWPTGRALALLIIHVLHEEEMTSWIPELAVFTVEKGKLKVLARERYEDWTTEFQPAHNAGSGLSLNSYQVHPKALALGVSVKQVTNDQGMVEESAGTYLIAIEAEGFFELSSFDQSQLTSEIFRTQREDGTWKQETNVESMSSTMTVAKEIDEGLFRLEIEATMDQSRNGRVFHSETDLIIMCWDGEAYSDCTE